MNAPARLHTAAIVATIGIFVSGFVVLTVQGADGAAFAALLTAPAITRLITPLLGKSEQSGPSVRPGEPIDGQARSPLE